MRICRVYLATQVMRGMVKNNKYLIAIGVDYATTRMYTSENQKLVNKNAIRFLLSSQMNGNQLCTTKLQWAIDGHDGPKWSQVACFIFFDRLWH